MRRWRGRRAEPAEVHEHLAFLHAATVRIGGDLELTQVVTALCETMVPRLADLAAAYLYEAVLADGDLPPLPGAPPDAVLRQVSVADDARTRERTLAGTLAVSDLTGPFAASVASGQLVMWPDPDHDREVLQCVLPSATPGSLLVAPLRAGEHMLGFVVLLRDPERPGFDEIDVLTSTLMADQAAISVHKALLYQREARVADALQRSMLPKHPPRLPGVEIAYRYLPGNPSAQVGGDWFDAIPLSGSRVALIVGDVMGHGVHSAATMGQLRTAVRTLAALDPPPGQVLRHLDQLFEDTVGQHGEQYIATCVYCVYDPVARRCAIANAGHVPPVLRYADGRTELIPVPPGVPLGVGNVAFQTIEVPAPDGSLIALCTDGLVESRERDITEGISALRESLTTNTETPDDLCENVLKALHTGEREDDVALLIARFDGIPSASVANWIMRPHAQAARHVRGLIATTLTGWGLEDHIDSASLLATELVTNAIRYTTRPITMRLLRTETLLCEVTDDDHHLPVLYEPDTEAESGRGIFLVSRLSHRWGASHTAAGKAVWFELAL
ncbi:SpoIIE family protein phosphatase [Actinomadura sp. DC4]|uniref:ATP-binding SpoIIE family protein phosphatase n=1 Tax=Actinomadura sp. DC4 TaxID=3055069 RepID=UPI0025B011BE|nr:SpoIIE family protein phosphatase [Actinomadura sp. DC4]MDN3357976.1 SpoIIE family protein phosphatase [Actinomadura sp. DC4]